MICQQKNYPKKNTSTHTTARHTGIITNMSKTMNVANMNTNITIMNTGI